MTKSMKQFTLFSTVILSATVALFAADLTKAYDMPDASKIVEKDLIDGPTKFTMSKECKLDSAEAIARGKYLYHNLNSDTTKDPAPKGLATPKEGEVKAYGNCVACHNIEGAVGGGTVGPPLGDYFNMMIKTKARDAQFVYQKIADPRIDNKDTSMTINLTSKMFNAQEVCDVTAYVLQIKTEKKK